MKTFNTNRPQIFNYRGNEITFLNGEGVMVNATEMAKAFGKAPKDYLKTQSANDLIEAVSARTNVLPTDLVTVINGGANYGTWMEETIALDFAQWLSVDFKLWCSDRLKEMLKYGATAIHPEDLLDPDYVIKVMTALKSERAEKELAQSKIKELEPKALFADSVASSKDSILIGELAKILNQNGVKIGQNRLFAWLRGNNYLISRGEQRNLPTQRFVEQGIFEIKKTAVNLPDGTTISNSTTKVTGKGQVYLVNKFLNERAEPISVLPLSERRD